MEPLSIAINFRDAMTLVVVWELHGGYWEILSVVRLKAAIALAQKSPTTRLIFPTGVFPDGVWGGIYKHHATKTSSKKVDTLLERREKVLQLLSKSPGQTKDAIASSLDVSVATAIQLLRLLEDNGDIHSRPHPMQNKTKLYYTASSAPTNTGKTDNQRSSVRSHLQAPPLKVYFVDPRTLQQVNR